MLPIERRCRKIIVARMDFEAVKPIDRGFGPLPHVTDDIKEIIFKGVSIDRARRHAMFEIDVSRSRFPKGLVGVDKRSKLIPLRFSWHANVGPGDFGLPVAKRFGLEIVDFGRPIPGHVNHFKHRAILIAVLVLKPIDRVLSFCIPNPVPAFFGPEFFGLVSTGVDEFKELLIGNQKL